MFRKLAASLAMLGMFAFTGQVPVTFNGGVNQTLSGLSPMANVVPQGQLQLYGDSTMFCNGALIGSNQCGPLSTGNILAANGNLSLYDYGVASSYESDIAAQMLNSYVQPLTYPSLITPANSVIVGEGMINDASVCGNTTDCLNNAIGPAIFTHAWAELPQANWIMASAATPSGTWAADGSIGINSSVSGTAMKSTTNASALQFNLAAGFGPEAGFCWEAFNSNTGTFNLVLGGSAGSGTITAFNTGSTTFQNSGSGATALNLFYQPGTIFCQRIPVTANVTGTLTATVSSATGAGNKVTILGVYQVPPAGTTVGPTFMQVGVLKQGSDANSAATAAFDLAMNTLTANDLADGEHVYWTDMRNAHTVNGFTSPGITLATDYMPGSGLCTNALDSSSTLHLNPCGQLHQAQSIAATALQNGVGFESIPQAAQPRHYFPSGSFAGGYGIYDFNQGLNPGNNPNYSTTSINGLWLSRGPASFTISNSGIMQFYDTVLSKHTTAIVNGQYGAIDFVNCPNQPANQTACSPSGRVAYNSTASNGQLQMGSFEGIGTIPALANVTGTDAINTGSTNVAGSITSSTSGAVSFTLTWGAGTAYTHQANCIFRDQTTVADTVNQTAATTSTVTAGGTVVSGDVIIYSCTGW